MQFLWYHRLRNYLCKFQRPRKKRSENPKFKMKESNKFWKPGQEHPTAFKHKNASNSQNHDKLSASEGRGAAKEQTTKEKSKKGSSMIVLAKVADADALRPELSKSVMSMKFMKRKNEASEESDVVEAMKRSKVIAGNPQLSSELGGVENKTSSVEKTLQQMQVLNSAREANRVEVSNALSSALRSDLSAENGQSLQCTYESTNMWSALPGRRSFGGFNVVVERWYASVMDTRHHEAKYGSKDSSADDEEMLRKYEKLASLPRGPSLGAKPVTKGHGANKDKSARNKNKH